MTNFYQSLVALSLLAFPAIASAQVLESYTLTPPSGSVVAEFGDIDVSFGEAVSPDWDLMNAAVLTGEGESYNPIVMSSPNDGGRLRFYQKPTTPGSYVLTVAEGAWITDDGRKSPAITATYTLGEVSSTEWYSDIVLTPADGAAVESISQITIRFEGTEDGIINDDMLSGAQAATLKNSKTGQEYVPTIVTLTKDCEGGVLHFDEITEPGNYQLIVSAGLFLDNVTEAESPEIRATYTIKGQSADWYSDIVLNPADGAEVGSLKNIDIQFLGTADGLDDAVSLRGEELATLTCGDKVIPVQMAVVAGSEYEIGRLVFDEITEPGTYQLWVAEGAFVDYETQSLSPEIRATYTVKGEAPGWYSEIVLTPADGAEVGSLKNIDIQFLGTGDGLDDGLLSGANLATLTCGDNVYNVQYGVVTGDEYEIGRLVFEEITEPGAYQLWVAEGAFVDYETQSPSPELRATYIVTGSQDEPEYMQNYTIDPADGSEVTSISQITITFEAEDGIEVTPGIDPAEASIVEGEVDEYGAQSITLARNDMNSGVITFEQITEPGLYAVWVAEGVFYDYETHAVNPEILIELTVKKADGILSVEASAVSPSAIYDLQGRKLSGKPASGIYIIDGKKVMIK